MKTEKLIRKIANATGIVVALVVCGLAFHYYVRLLLLEQTVVAVVPGKWVWVECQTPQFSATIDQVGVSGVTISVGAPLPIGLPCKQLGIIALGNGKYFFPFRTVLALRQQNKVIWSNPNSI